MELILSRAETGRCTQRYGSDRVVGTASPWPLLSPLWDLFSLSLLPTAHALGSILSAASRLNLSVDGKSRTSHYAQNAVYISVLKNLYQRDRRVAELVGLRLSGQPYVCALDRSLH